MVEPEPLGMRCVGVLDQHLDVRHGSRQLSGKPIDRLLNPFRELLVAGGVLVHGLSVTLSFWGPATILVAVLESFTELVSGSPWTYGAILLVAALDAFFPVVPSETMVVAGGVLAANGDLELGFLIPAAAVGAIIGDHVSYTIGRTVGERITDRVFRGKRKRHLDRAERMLNERGGYLIVIGRFIPGGRTATTFAAGTLELPLRRFFSWDVLAGVFWGLYASLIGFFGGKAFEDDPTRGILLALGIAFALAVLIEAWRWWRKRVRNKDLGGGAAAHSRLASPKRGITKVANRAIFVHRTGSSLPGSVGAPQRAPRRREPAHTRDVNRETDPCPARAGWIERQPSS